MKRCQRKGWWKLEVENAEVTRAEQASSEWRGGGGVGGWRCPQTLELREGRGYRALEMSQGWKGAIQGAEAIRPHLSSCTKKKNYYYYCFWPCYMACGILGTKAVSPAVDCQISPSVASLFKNIYLIFKILFLCGFLITSWWIICSLPPAVSLSLPLAGVCVCVFESGGTGDDKG